MPTPILMRLDWPDFGAAAPVPDPVLADYEVRLAATRAAMAAAGHDVLVVYGDREHAANLHWLTGFDPRFEEAVLIVTPDRLTLITGNECVPYTVESPVLTAPYAEVQLCGTLSLPSQPRGQARIADLLCAAIPAGATVGAAGWKWFGADEVADPDTTLDLPAFLADPIRARAARVLNATALFMHPAYGLRTRADAAEIARFEFAGQMAGRALQRLVFSLREGITDFAAIEAAGLGGLPLGCHVTFGTGPRQGMSSASGRRLSRGEPASFNICHWRANACRAGWLASGPADLPPMARDYVDAFAGPYVAAMSGWLSLMRPGTSGGEVQARMDAALPAALYGVMLNPGHLIGLDEWMCSPVSPGSAIPLASGMVMQCDVIPGHPAYGSTRMEDGFAIADNALRADLARRFPDVAARCTARQVFLRKTLGFDLPDACLPLADTCGLVAPYLFDPGRVIALR
jgi:Xaa-Pro aminopeptidase